MFGTRVLGDGTFHVHRPALTGEGTVLTCTLAAAHVFVRCPAFGSLSRKFTRAAYVKTSRSCHTTSRAGVWDRELLSGDGTFHAHRPTMGGRSAKRDKSGSGDGSWLAWFPCIRACYCGWWLGISLVLFYIKL